MRTIMYRLSFLSPLWSDARRRGRLLVILAAVLWSMAGVFIKSLSLPPETIAFYRFLFAAAFFFFFLKPRDIILDRRVFFSITTYVIATGSFVWANKLTTAANAIVLQYTAPIYIYALIPLLFREKISRPGVLALCGGMSGIGVIFIGSVGEPEMAGIWVALFSGLFFALYIVNLRFLSGTSPTYLVLINNLGGVVLFLPMVAQHLYLLPYQLVALICMGVFQFGGAYFVFSKGVESTPLQEASLLLLLEPVLNPLWVNLVVGEVPSMATAIGGGVILLSLGVYYRFAALSSEPLGS